MLNALWKKIFKASYIERYQVGRQARCQEGPLKRIKHEWYFVGEA